MESLVVECLNCRTIRVARRDRFKHFESPECPECGYLGWAPVLELTGADRRAPRERRRDGTVGGEHGFRVAPDPIAGPPPLSDRRQPKARHEAAVKGRA